MTIRVLVADDQTLVRAGFRMILRAEPDIEVVGEAADGAEAIELARELDPDVVLMDVRMPNVDGIEATRRIIDGSEHAPRVLVLTTFDLDEYVYEALRAGASGFLLKDAPGRAARVRDQDRRRRRIALRPGRHPAADRAVRRRRAKEPPPALAELTPRELEVLRLVARGLSNAEIAAELVTHRAHRQDPRRAHPRQARPARPGQAVVLAYESGIVRARR